MGREKTITAQPTTEQRICKNCGRPAARRRSRCATCYNYYSRTGKERPPELYGRKLPVDLTGTPQWCEVCGDTRLWRGNKCQACYAYWVKHRKKRPKRLWDDDATCRNCGIPLNAVGKQKSGRRRQAKGYCLNCYTYKNRTGKERPKEFWGDGPHGFCECGYPAVALVQDIPVCARHKE